jgi:hypothetical protein
MRFVDFTKLETIEPDTCTATTDIRLEGTYLYGREAVSTSWASHIPATYRVSTELFFSPEHE